MLELPSLGLMELSMWAHAWNARRISASRYTDYDLYMCQLYLMAGNFGGVLISVIFMVDSITIGMQSRKFYPTKIDDN